MAGYVPPWQHEFRRVPCLLCGNDERVVLVSPGMLGRDADVGICEACAVHAHWTWRTLSGDAAPTADASRVTKVKVVVSRLAKLPTGEPCVADHPDSYEIAMAPAADGYHDLPTAELQPGEDEISASSRALASVGLATWPIFLESLHAGHTPRGSLVRIYLATAYADASPADASPPLFQWRRWPPWEHARGLYGLYVGLREIWLLRIAVLRAREPGREQITTHVRRGAAEYIRIQQRLREDPGADTSMAAYLRQSMSDDERAACRRVLETADLEAELRTEREVPAEESVESGEYREGAAQQEAAEDLLKDDDVSLDEAFGNEQEDP